MHSAPRVPSRTLAFALALLTLAVLQAPSASASNESVEPHDVMTVSLALDRTSYLSGDMATARATVYRTPVVANYTYTWRVRDFLFRVLTTATNTNSAFDYPIPLNYTGAIHFDVTVNDDRGLSAGGGISATVSIAVMSLRLDRGDFTPGDTITATYSVLSHVLLRPTYDYQIDDSSATIVDSGTTNATSFSFMTPVPASQSYAFLVTAREGLDTAEARATIAQASGVLLGIAFDKAAYAPGDTIVAHLTLIPRGTAALPRQFEWTLSIGPFGGPSARAITTEPQVDLFLPIPSRIGTGDLLVFAIEARTGAAQLVTVHVGTTNPLWTTEIAGIPLFAILLGLLSLAIFVAFVGLWRRVATVPAAREMPLGPMEPVGPPGPPPPEPPRARGPAAAPMTVSCQHCAKPIELTTSRRPIEVMCPSCGETQLIT